MKDFAKVAVRIFSLYFMIKFIGSLGSMITYITAVMNVESGMRIEDVYGIVFAFVVNALICILLWVFSDRIASLITRNSEVDSHIRIDIDYMQTLKISLKITGIVLIVLSLEKAFYEVISIFSINMNQFDIKERLMMLIQMLFPFIKIVIGIVLIASDRLHKMIGIKEI